MNKAPILEWLGTGKPYTALDLIAAKGKALAEERSKTSSTSSTKEGLRAGK